MGTIANLPAHILLNHFVVVLVPLTAILLILCALWPAARQRLSWLVAALAAITVVLTPVTIKAGEWLGDRVDETPDLDTHMNAGETAFYLAALPVFVAAALLLYLHVRLDREHPMPAAVRWGSVAVVIVLAALSMFEIHTIGESGARAAWCSVTASCQ